MKNKFNKNENVDSISINKKEEEVDEEGKEGDKAVAIVKANSNISNASNISSNVLKRTEI